MANDESKIAQSVLIRTNLRRYMARMGVSRRNLSMQAGGGVDLVRQILNRRSISPRTDTIRRLADALACTPDQLTGDADFAHLAPEEATAERDVVIGLYLKAEQMREDAETANEPEKSQLLHDANAIDRLDDDFDGEESVKMNEDTVFPVAAAAADLPVYASAEGGPEGMVITFDPIEFVKRPAPLANVPGGFAMYVVNDSMEPKFKHGDMILVHPKRPVSANDYVLVVMADGNGDHSAMVKRFVRRREGALTVSQFNPPRDIEIAEARLHGVYLIVGSYEAR